MQLLGLASALAFSVTGALVGLRLLRLWLDTRQVPELSIGAALFAIAVVGYPSMLMAHVLGQLGSSAAMPATIIGVVSSHVAIMGVWTFTWRVFRLRATWGRLVLVAAGLAHATIAVGTVQAIVAAEQIEPYSIVSAASPWSEVNYVAFAAAFFWAGAESFRYYRLMRKRLALGLAAPVVVNRFLLWGVLGLETALVNGAMGVLSAMGYSVITHPLPMLLSGVSGLASCVFWWLTFMPPQRYLDFIQRRHAQSP
ncbi:MAG: hypothetical protein MJE66_23520 [Proteobacteria bacterium]|nr:hypothetical protein [Pseudomonadota bacterium]